MKKSVLLVVLMVIGNLTFGQSIIEKHYQKYVEDENVTHVFVSSKFFDFATAITSGMDDEDVKELSEFAANIESFSLIKVPQLKDAVAEYNKGMSSLPSSYDELVRVRAEGNRFTVLVDEEDDIVYELVGLGIADGDFIAFSLIGELDLNKISEFISKANNDMLAPVKEMVNEDVAEVKVYPNPATANSRFMLDVPENLIDARVNIYNMNGERVREFIAKSETTQINTNNLPAGNYYVEVQNDTFSVKKKLIVIQ